MDRRKFITIMTATLFAKDLLANTNNPFKKAKTTNISMAGDLDDDLFIIKSTPNANTMTHCFQMHNPKSNFNYHGVNVKSENIYGIIDFKDSFQLEKNEILSVFVANEREEMYDLPKLRARTHFKAVPFYVENQILIPSLIPENNDVPNYPVWFGNDEGYCDITKPQNYNYYKLWENAVCGGGFVFTTKGKVEIKLFNEENDLMFTYEETISTEPSNLISNEVKHEDFERHLLAEIDGGVYNQERDNVNNAFVMRYAITKALIIKDGKTFKVDFPYPLPYPNRLYAMSLK